MNNRSIISFLLCFLIFNATQANALPTFVGKYGGFTRDKVTGFLATYTNRNVLKSIEIASLNAACLTSIPGEDQSTSERDTTISKAETPSIRVNANGKFNASFTLNNPSRVDFRGATVIIDGRLRGGRGKVNISIAFAKTFEDGSSQTCSGAAVINLKRSAR